MVTVGHLAVLLRLAKGQPPSAEPAHWSDILQGLTAPIFGIAFIITAVMFIRWQRAAYDAAASVQPVDMPYSKPWTVWGWIVPVMFFWVPYRIVKSIWISTSKEPPVLVKWWWSLWLTMLVLWVISDTLSEYDVVWGISALLWASGTELVGHVSGLLGALVAASMVRQASQTFTGKGQCGGEE